MKLEASLEVRTNKEGAPYECVVLKLTDKIEKLVFLTPAEKELLKIKYNTENLDNKDANPYDF